MQAGLLVTVLVGCTLGHQEGVIVEAGLESREKSSGLGHKLLLAGAGAAAGAFLHNKYQQHQQQRPVYHGNPQHQSRPSYPTTTHYHSRPVSTVYTSAGRPVSYYNQPTVTTTNYHSRPTYPTYPTYQSSRPTYQSSRPTYHSRPSYNPYGRPSRLPGSPLTHKLLAGGAGLAAGYLLGKGKGREDFRLDDLRLHPNLQLDQLSAADLGCVPLPTGVVSASGIPIYRCAGSDQLVQQLQFAPTQLGWSSPVLGNAQPVQAYQPPDTI